MSVLDAKRHHEHLVEELIAEVEAYNPEVDKELLRHSFEIAERAHEGQTRRSGEEFIHHPLGVARICAELHLDEQTIAAALLHDVVEDRAPTSTTFAPSSARRSRSWSRASPS